MVINDKCGVVGIFSKKKKDVSLRLYNALAMIQHRGQDSAGISTFNGEKLSLKRDVGLVPDVFKKQDLEKLKGYVGLGHVRYPTIGTSFYEDAQPVLVDQPLGGIVLAHNGNIVNYAKIRKKIEKKGIRFSAKCDAELILRVFVEGLRLNKNNMFKAAEHVMNTLDGAYSVVLITGRGDMLAFKDPHAIKPLVFGKTKDLIAFASESVSFNINGITKFEEVKAGEVIYISPRGKITRKIVKQLNNNHCFFEYVYFARPDSVMNGKLIYDIRYNMGIELAKESNTKADVVVPVPDTSRVAAQGYSSYTGIPVVEGIMKNRYVGRTFIMPSQEKRDIAIKLKLNIVEPLLKGKDIILIDDSIVRGTTMRGIIKRLREAGVKKIHLKITSPPITAPCFYGIDLPDFKKLVAANHSVKKITKMLGADTLQYLSHNGLYKSIGIPESNLCTGCITGKYITKEARLVSKKLKKGTTNSKKRIWE